MQDIFIFIQHHWLLSAAFAIVLLVLIALEFIKIRRGTLQVSPQEAILLINHENAIVVDIRTSDAYVNGHIVNAISLPLSDIEAKHKKLDKFKTNPILITCATGLESSTAADSLTKHGFNVRVLAGGIRSWKDAEMPLVKGI